MAEETRRELAARIERPTPDAGFARSRWVVRERGVRDAATLAIEAARAAGSSEVHRAERSTTCYFLHGGLPSLTGAADQILMDQKLIREDLEFQFVAVQGRRFDFAPVPPPHSRLMKKSASLRRSHSEPLRRTGAAADA